MFRSNDDVTHNYNDTTVKAKATSTATTAAATTTKQQQLTELRFLLTRLMALIMWRPNSTQQLAWSGLATGSPATQ